MEVTSCIGFDNLTSWGSVMRREPKWEWRGKTSIRPPQCPHVTFMRWKVGTWRERANRVYVYTNMNSNRHNIGCVSTTTELHNLTYPKRGHGDELSAMPSMVEWRKGGEFRSTVGRSNSRKKALIPIPKGGHRANRGGGCHTAVPCRPD